MATITSALFVVALASAPLDGEALFKSYCASCHGVSAKGNGVMAPYLRFRPADLTLIAKRRAGRFEVDEVFRIVDGRTAVAGHGGTDMPVWGDAFRQSAQRYSEKAVKARIRALVDYLKTIQVK
jgi:mono/diheme cytochrome c family protein